MTRLLSEEQYKSALIEQNMRCAICGDHSKKQRDSFCIDHNHRTGRIRGILCSRCNSGLGFFRDSRSLLNRAERYLERYEWVGKGNPFISFKITLCSV